MRVSTVSERVQWHLCFALGALAVLVPFVSYLWWP